MSEQKCHGGNRPCVNLPGTHSCGERLSPQHAGWPYPAKLFRVNLARFGRHGSDLTAKAYTTRGRRV